MGQPHDAFHVVVDALDEAGRRLRRLVSAGGPDDGAGLFIPPPVVGWPGDPVTVIQPDVEPDRRIERAVLVHAQGRQLIVEPLAILDGGEVAIGSPPVGNRPRHAVDELANRVLALPLQGTAVAAGHVAVEVLAGDHVGGELAPAAGNLAIRLLEDRPPTLVLDFRGPEVPLDAVKRADPLVLKTRGTSMPVRFRPRSLEPSVSVPTTCPAAVTNPARSPTVAMCSTPPETETIDNPYQSSQADRSRVYPVYVQKSIGAFPSSNNRHPAVSLKSSRPDCSGSASASRESAVAIHGHMDSANAMPAQSCCHIVLSRSKSLPRGNSIDPGSCYSCRTRDLGTPSFKLTPTGDRLDLCSSEPGLRNSPVKRSQVRTDRLTRPCIGRRANPQQSSWPIMKYWPPDWKKTTAYLTEMAAG